MTRTVDELVRENAQLRRRLEESEETLEAIREGNVDAFVVLTPEQEQIVALDSADRPYRLLVEQMQQGAVTVASDGTILYGNRRFSDMLGVLPHDIVGASIYSHVDPGSRNLFDRLLREGEAGSGLGEVTLRVKGDVPLPVYLAVNRVPQGAPGLCLIITDLTERKRHEQVVAEEILARSIFEQAGDAIVVFDGTGTIIRASRAADELCGSSPIGRKFEDAFPSLHSLGGCCEGCETGTLRLEDFLDRGTMRGVQVCFKRSDGETFDLLLSSSPLIDVEHVPLGSVVTLSNITLLKRAEKALKEADRRKDEFLAMLGHELRNPLAAMNNAVQLTTLCPDRDQIDWSLDVINRQIRHLTRLIDDLLDISRITRGKVSLRKEPIDAQTVITSAVEAVRPLVKEREHELTVSLTSGGMRLEADPTRLEQIVVNLLTNAAKYTDRGGQIWLTAERRGDDIVVSVRDNGTGIAPDRLPQMFELFVQGDRTLARSEGGLGIGLTLVRSLAEMHGGSVSARSDGPGQGSEFIVRLPAVRNQPASSHLAEQKPLTEAKRTARILVVDDNVDTARGMAKLLRLLGHDVHTAHDGPSALDEAQAFGPEYVLLDIGLPGMDGYQVATRLRQDGHAGSTIIAVSGYGQDEDRRRSAQAGFDHHLVKPVDHVALLGLLPH